MLMWRVSVECLAQLMLRKTFGLVLMSFVNRSMMLERIAPVQAQTVAEGAPLAKPRRSEATTAASS
jgi:hypothetical protein